MPTELERIQLEKRRTALVRQLRGLGNLMRGTLYTAHVRCGSPRCECARGEKHAKIHLSVNMKGRTRGLYVGEKRAAAVATLLEEYQRAWRIIEELTEVNLELLRPTRNREEGRHR